MGPDATLDNIWTATCSNGHVMGDGASHINLSSLGMFYELSLVPMGAVNGARVVDPATYSEPVRMAASAKGPTAFAVELSATPKEQPVDLTAFTAAISAAAVEKAALEAAVAAKAVLLAAAVADLAAVKVTLAAAEARIVELSAGELATVKAELAAAKAASEAAVEHLTGEAKKILTACGVTDHRVIPADVAGIAALIAEKRAQFAASIPVGGAAAAAAAAALSASQAPAPRPTGAFSAPARS